MNSRSDNHHKPRNIQERTFAFACCIVNFSRRMYAHGPTAQDLARQLFRAGTSIGANLEEADAGQSRADFVSKCSIALKEARETHYWLRIIKETALAPLSTTEPLISESDEVVAILTTIVKKARSS